MAHTLASNIMTSASFLLFSTNCSKRNATHYFSSMHLGAVWKGSLIQCNCDNEAVVTVLNSGAAKDRQLAHMLRCMFFLHLKFNFHLRACHIPGTEYLAADALSRNQMALFFSCNSQVDSEAILIPLKWPALLLDPEVVWTSQHWTS